VDAAKALEEIHQRDNEHRAPSFSAGARSGRRSSGQYRDDVEETARLIVQLAREREARIGKEQEWLPDACSIFGAPEPVACCFSFHSSRQRSTVSGRARHAPQNNPGSRFE